MDINELETYRLSDAVKFNSELNPRLWGSDQHLRLDVREQLLKIASDFREFLGVNDLDLKDITISGSNAAYSYTPHSDIDLHLVVDIPDDPIYQELFTAKKYQYNDEYNFKIGPYDIELYVQDSKQPHASQGIYSIKDNKWLSVPRRRQPNIDDISVRSKYEDLGHRIDSAIEDADLKKLDDIANKIKEMRKAGLAQTGEFGPENLAFKILRNNGTLDRLHAARLQAKSQAYSIKERKKPKFKYGNFGFLGVLNTSPEQTDVEVAESVKQPDIIAELNSFVKFCAGWLELGALPGVRYKKDPAWSERNKTFGRYDEQTNTLYVSLTNRHLLDIMRTVAHELTHHKQNEHNDLTPLSGSTGSHQENEANSLAGQIMRDYADERPDLFQYNINESIKNRLAAAAAAACIAGTPGCATVAPAVKDIQTVGRTVQTMKGYGAAGARDELTQRFKDELRRRQGQVVPEDYDADHPPGPETKPTMPKGTVRVDVSDMYDWYKLGKDISNLKAADKSQFGKGPPSTIISFGDEDTEHKYIKDLEKLGLTTTDIDPIDKNQPPGMKRQKVDPTYNVNEAFDQPYKLKWYPGDWDEVTAYADIPDGDDLTIMFNNDENEEGEEAWSVEFYRNDSQEITGEGDAQRIFATVLVAIKTFIKKYKPNRLIFSASKEVEPGQKIQSRANLYDRLVQRYAQAMGYRAFRADAGNKVHYELSRINKGVAEGSLNEYRDALYNFVRSKFPTWPEYVLKDFLYAQAKGIRDKEELKDFLERNQKDFGQVKWRLEKLPITLDIFTPKTQRMIKQREGGNSNPFQVPKDVERHAQQLKMIQQQGVRTEPIIVAKLNNGYDLIEGWHRTIQHLQQYPEGYTGPAWVAYGATYTSESKQGVAEGAMKDLDIDIQDQQWDAVVGYVVNGVKKGMDTDRMELALYKWASRELVDVEQALEDHGFRDIADLADHIEQHNGRYVPPGDFGLSKIGKGLTEASGYIPVNSKEARDPRYSMAITQDIKPGEVQRQARKMGFQTTAAGIPPTLRTSGKL